MAVSLIEQARVQKYGDLLLTCAAKGLVVNVHDAIFILGAGYNPDLPSDTILTLGQVRLLIYPVTPLSG